MKPLARRQGLSLSLGVVYRSHAASMARATASTVNPDGTGSKRAAFGVPRRAGLSRGFRGNFEGIVYRLIDN
jgi:hypothetical protein